MGRKKELPKAGRDESLGMEDFTAWLFDPAEARAEMDRIKRAEKGLEQNQQD